MFPEIVVASLRTIDSYKIKPDGLLNLAALDFTIQSKQYYTILKMKNEKTKNKKEFCLKEGSFNFNFKVKFDKIILTVL